MVWHIMTGPTNVLPFLEYILSDKYSRSLKDTRLRHNPGLDRILFWFADVSECSADT